MIATIEKPLSHRYKDETGNSYGRLTVVGDAGRDKHGNAIWLCRCSCGKEKVVGGASLRKGQSESCGCIAQERGGLRVIYEVGNIHGRWTVLRYAGRDRFDTVLWWCRCSCGAEKAFIGASLRKGVSTSCGCYNREKNRLPRGESAFNALYASMRKQARVRNYDFELTKEQVRNFTKKSCHYCAQPPSQIYKANSSTASNGVYIYSGLDRVNNDLGYVESNIVSCCWDCNRAKGSLTVVEFKSWLTRVYKHSTKGQSE